MSIPNEKLQQVSSVILRHQIAFNNLFAVAAGDRSEGILRTAAARHRQVTAGFKATRKAHARAVTDRAVDITDGDAGV